MANLKDFEELIAKIVYPEMKLFMKEAMSCYYAGAYRGCIILSYISLFEDLLKKLEAISDVNKKARRLHLDVSSRRHSQDVYENYLIEQLLSNNLISTLEKETLDLIKKLRHKSAHPCGHNPTAEEARYLFSEVINKFLSKPILNTNSIVDRILTRLDNANFFPSNYINDTKEITAHEIKNLHPESYPYLVNKIFGEYKESTGIRNKNASFLLDGMAAMNDDILNEKLIAQVISKILDDDQHSSKILSMICANSKLLTLIAGVDRTRFNALLLSKINGMADNEVSTKISHPVNVMRAIDEIGLFDDFKEHFKVFTVKVPYRAGMLKILNNHKDELLELYLEKIYSDAGSFTFDTANMFIIRFTEIEGELISILNDEQSFKLLCHIVSAARHGAFDSESIVNSKFEKFPNLKNKALDYIIHSAQIAERHTKAIVSSYLDLSELCYRYL